MGGTLFFLTKAGKDNWQEVAAIRIEATGWATLAIALGVTLVAHIWSGWVWTWMLDELNQTVLTAQFVQVYLKTNIAKYLPGNVWHYYGRIAAAKTAGITASVATLSVLLEPLLMAAAALLVVLVSIQSIAVHSQSHIQGLLVLILAAVLLAVHPRFLNLAIRFLRRFKLKSANSNATDSSAFHVKRYPWRPLLGELGFIGLRGTGFLLTLLALDSVAINQIPLLMGAFSLAWLLGLVIPGAPGGLGVFEVTAITLLQHSFSPGLVISAIALYRLVSILAEAAGAGFAWLDEKLVKP
ncbi:MAG: lysylphosphatidylglycerol synthase domain-containing protein [Gammaproteobacteria bacterium]|nr:lysylphosphatidylglycerol synthase domain-containing protein [Gammaproteobacteria bacterium]